MGETSPDSADIEIRWFPPSWLLIQTPDKVVYIDPAWMQEHSKSYPRGVVFSDQSGAEDGLPEPDLPKADLILLTHHHHDHVNPLTLNRLASSRTVIIAPPACAEPIGRKFQTIEPGGETERLGMHIRAVHAYNTPQGHSTRKAHQRGECVGYVLTIAGRTIYHAGDTDLIPEMAELGKLDVAFLPVGGTYTMDVDEALEAAGMIRPGRMVPMHYLHSSPQALLKKAAGIPGVKVEILDIGGRLRLAAK